jgi:hypothetical protein
MAKEFAFKKCFRNSAAVNSTKQIIFSYTGMVYYPGNVFLSCSAFSGN